MSVPQTPIAVIGAGSWGTALALLLARNGYMTLYGRNHTLYKKVGDVVRPGDLIATVGQTGGFDEAGLYFAIRHNAQPLDPAIWCHG